MEFSPHYCINSKKLSVSFNGFDIRELKLWIEGIEELVKEKKCSRTKISISYNYSNDENEIKKFISFFEKEQIFKKDPLISMLPQKNKIKVSRIKSGYVLNIENSFIHINYNQNEINFYDAIDENLLYLPLIKFFIASIFVVFGEMNVVHGNVLRHNGCNYLITNKEKTGKTSFSLLFALNGGEWITDDITYVNNGYFFLTQPFRDWLNIRKGTFNYFTKELDRLKEKIVFENEEELSVKIDFFIDKNRDEKVSKLSTVLIPEISEYEDSLTITELKNFSLYETCFNNDPTLNFLVPFLEKKVCREENLEPLKVFTVKSDFNYKNYFKKIIQLVEV